MSVAVPIDTSTEAAAAAARKHEDAAGSGVAVKTCPGIEARPGGKKIGATRKRCKDCGRLKQQGDNRSYYQANEAALKEKRRDRYQQEQADEDRKLVRQTVAWMKREQKKARDRSFWRSTTDEARRRRMASRPMPKRLRRVRRPRRERIIAEALAFIERQNQRKAVRARKTRNDRTKVAPPMHALTVPRAEVFTKNGAVYYVYRRPEDRQAGQTGIGVPQQPAAGARQPPPGEQQRQLAALLRPAASGTTVGGTHSGATGQSNQGKNGMSSSAKRRGRPRLTEAEKFRRRLARSLSLFWRVELEKKPHHVAWYESHPKSRATRETATREAKRAIAWFVKTYPPGKGVAMVLTGLYDPDVIIRGLKEALNATRTVRGEIDFPDWRVRRMVLKRLMICLDLATPRGFKSGPRAVGGALENVPLAGTAVPPGDEDAAAYTLRRLRAEAISFRHKLDGKPLADCWFEVNPQSKANPGTAKKEARKLLDWYEPRSASWLAQRLIADGLDNFAVLDRINEMMTATTIFGAPDWTTRTQGRHLLMVLHGFHHPHRKDIPDHGPSLIDAIDCLKKCESIEVP